MNGAQFRARRQNSTMKYICLGYIDSNAFASVPEAEQQAMMDSCFVYDDQLRANGHFKGGEALQPPNTAMTLRYANGRVVVTDGPFCASDACPWPGEHPNRRVERQDPCPMGDSPT